ncbi:MAG: epimerase [Polyangiales bacterium]
MIGQGVLRECLIDPSVERVLAVGRSATGQKHDKLRELVHKDLTNYAGVAAELSGYDACFFCLGVSSAGMSETDYRRVTYDIAVAAASTLVEKNANMTFIFVSGAGSDETGKSRMMWARVKGETENAILKFPFREKFVFRPAFVRPLHGITSRTRAYRAAYAVVGPIFPLLNALFPRSVTTTERVARAMLHVARRGYRKAILENDAINAAAGASNDGDVG